MGNHRFHADQRPPVVGREKKTRSQKNAKVVEPKSSLPSMDCCDQNFSPSRQIARLELKSKVKQPKLLSSKSLSQLIPRGLFFKKNSSSSNDNDKGEKTDSKFTSTKSFPSNAYQPNCMINEGAMPEFINRVNSVSLIGLPRQSSSNSFASHQQVDNCTLVQPNLSPIVGGQACNDESFSFTESSQEPKQTGQESKEEKKASDETKKTETKYKPFKATTLVLRDVKNSIGLRMRAKHESRAFAKLTNELSTPPTKLYSPFNIYTPDSATKESKRKSNLKAGKQAKPDTDCSMTIDEVETPKRRIALQHKKHLMQTSKFTFDSPTGKLRETVKEVEHFQQCIEDISKAIRARDGSSR